MLTNYRRADEGSDSLEEEQETKGVGELVGPKEVGQHQGGQQNVCGTVLCNLVLQMIILEKKPNSLNVGNISDSSQFLFCCTAIVTVTQGGIPRLVMP